jgi:hypothetical protein
MQTRDHAIAAVSGANHNIRMVIIWDEECGVGHVLKAPVPEIFPLSDNVWIDVRLQVSRIIKTIICDREKDLGKGTISVSPAGLQGVQGRDPCVGSAREILASNHWVVPGHCFSTVETRDSLKCAAVWWIKGASVTCQNSVWGVWWPWSRWHSGSVVMAQVRSWEEEVCLHLFEALMEAKAGLISNKTLIMTRARDVIRNCVGEKPKVLNLASWKRVLMGRNDPQKIKKASRIVEEIKKEARKNAGIIEGIATDVPEYSII